MIRILQLTDTHIFGTKPSIFLGIDSLKNLEAVIAATLENIKIIKPKLIVLTGDLSHDRTEQSYKYIKEQLNKFSIPIAIIPGNHDDPEIMDKILNNQQKEFAFNNWHIILLNSYYRDHDSGMLNKDELMFLDHNLEKNHGKNIIIFLHHHIIETDCLWLDNMGVQNSEDFLAILDKYKNIKIVSSGHGHQEFSRQYKNIEFLITPSTSVQFKPKSKIFTLDNLMPGFRWFNLYSDGNYETGIIRLKTNKEFIPDLETEGY